MKKNFVESKTLLVLALGIFISSILMFQNLSIFNTNTVEVDSIHEYNTQVQVTAGEEVNVRIPMILKETNSLRLKIDDIEDIAIRVTKFDGSIISDYELNSEVDELVLDLGEQGITKGESIYLSLKYYEKADETAIKTLNIFTEVSGENIIVNFKLIMLFIFFIVGLISIVNSFHIYINREFIKSFYMRKIKKYEKWGLDFITYGILSLLTAISVFRFMFNLYYFASTSWVAYTVTVLMLILFILSFIMLLFLNKNRLHRMFLVIAIPTYMMVMVLMMPNYPPDEETHFSKVYQISMFNLFNKNAKMPLSYYGYRPQNYMELLLVIKSPTTEMVDTTTFASNSFMSYIPSAVGVMLSRLFTSSPYLQMYFGRIANLVFSLLCGYHVIKRVPIAKWVFFVYMLSPMFVQQSVSITNDTVLHSICLLFLVKVLHIRYKEGNLTSRNIIILGFYASLILILKFANAPLLLTSLILLPYIKKEDIKLIVGVVISMLALYYLHSKLFPAAEQIPAIAEYTSSKGINMSEQITYVLGNPIRTIKNVLYSIFEMKSFYVKTFVGQYLGPFTVHVKPFITPIYLILLISSVFVSSGDEVNPSTIKASERLLYAVTGIGSILLIVFAMYLAWTPVGGRLIEGVQGRYFIASVILLLLALVPNKRFSSDKYKYVVLFTLMCIYLFVFVSLLSNFMLV